MSELVGANAPDRSACPHCGRPTRTTPEGACADCWQAKPGGLPVIRDPGPRSERLLDDGAGWLGLLPPWAWWTLAGALVGAPAAAVAAALT